MAVFAGKLETTRFLIENKADVNIPDKVCSAPSPSKHVLLLPLDVLAANLYLAVFVTILGTNMLG